MKGLSLPFIVFSVNEHDSMASMNEEWVERPGIASMLDECL